jgi:hypothetical protein
MKKLVHILLIGLALLGSLSIPSFAEGSDPMPTGTIPTKPTAR